MKISINVAHNEGEDVCYLFLESESGIPCKDWGEVGRKIRAFKRLCKRPETKEQEPPTPVV